MRTETGAVSAGYEYRGSDRVDPMVRLVAKMRKTIPTQADVSGHGAKWNQLSLLWDEKEQTSPGIDPAYPSVRHGTHANEGVAEKRLDEGANRTLCLQDGWGVLGRHFVETQLFVEGGRILERQ